MVKSFGITTKLSLAIALLVTVSLGTLSLLAVMASRRSLREQVQSANLTAATLAARAVEKYVADAASIMREAPGRPKLSRETRAANWPEVEAVLENFHRNFTQFDYVFVQDRQGIIRVRVPHAQTVGRDFSFREFFQETMRTRRLYVSGLYISTAAGRPVVSIAVPVLDEAGEVKAVVVGALSLAALADFLSTIGRDGGLVYVVDAKGVLIAHSGGAKPVLPGTEVKGLPIVQAALAGRSGTMEFHEPARGERFLGAYVPMPSLGWGIVAAQPVSVAYAAGQQLGRWLVWITVGFAAGAIVVGWLLARTLTGPLLRLAQATDKLGAGDFDVRVTREGYDEVAALATSFNIMADHLQRSYQGLEQKNAEIAGLNEQLEQRIEERTLQLKSANEELQAGIAERRRAEEEAERANRAKSDFLSRMSHELRTPLNSILGFSQILEMSLEKPREQECLAQILKGGRHLLSLVNEVLDIAGIEAGRLKISLESVQVGQVIAEALDLARPLGAPRAIQFQIDGADLHHEHVWADNQRLKQVLLNLLSNAIKYNRQAGRVTITCDALVPARVRISVTDTGPGIRAALLGRLFRAFERLGVDERGGVEGTGLGLALSKALVEAMGGTIGVDSAIGHGSTFWVELRRSEAPTNESVQSNGAQAMLARSDQRGTVLYIEDNLSNVRLVERLLESRPGIKLLSTMQGRLGFELAAQHQPDVILLDVHLPDMSGDELLHKFKAEPTLREAPVIILSADATPSEMQRLLAAGARAYLTKPLDVRLVLGLIDEILRPNG